MSHFSFKMFFYLSGEMLSVHTSHIVLQQKGDSDISASSFPL